MKKGLLKALSCVAAAALTVMAFAMPRVALAAENVGAADLSSGWWGAHSEIYKVEEGKDVTFKFVNHSLKGENWHNAVVVLQNVATGHSVDATAGYAEYAVVRADNWGWGTGYEGATLDNNYNWDAFRDNIDGVEMTIVVSKKAGNKADVSYSFKGTDGVDYHMTYTGLTVGDELYTCLTVENCYLENVVVTVYNPTPVPETGVFAAIIPAAVVMLASGAVALKTSKKEEQ